MIQNTIVFLIFALAVIYMARNLYRNFKGNAGCACGCSGCADTAACEGRADDRRLPPEKDRKA